MASTQASPAGDSCTAANHATAAGCILPTAESCPILRPPFRECPDASSFHCLRRARRRRRLHQQRAARGTGRRRAAGRGPGRARLHAHHGDERRPTAAPFKLSAHRGETVVLAFFPKARTSGCTAQMHTYRDKYETMFMNGKKVRLIGISIDNAADLTAWAKDDGFQFALGADGDKAVGSLYGAATEAWLPPRYLYVIGPDGKIAYATNFRALAQDAYDDLDAALKKIARSTSPPAPVRDARPPLAPATARRSRACCRFRTRSARCDGGSRTRTTVAPVHMLALGKAAPEMARGAEAALQERQRVGGRRRDHRRPSAHRADTASTARRRPSRPPTWGRSPLPTRSPPRCPGWGRVTTCSCCSPGARRRLCAAPCAELTALVGHPADAQTAARRGDGGDAARAASPSTR